MAGSSQYVLLRNINSQNISNGVCGGARDLQKSALPDGMKDVLTGDIRGGVGTHGEGRLILAGLKLCFRKGGGSWLRWFFKDWKAFIGRERVLSS